MYISEMYLCAKQQKLKYDNTSSNSCSIKQFTYSNGIFSSNWAE